MFLNFHLGENKLCHALAERLGSRKMNVLQSIEANLTTEKELSPHEGRN